MGLQDDVLALLSSSLLLPSLSSLHCPRITLDARSLGCAGGCGLGRGRTVHGVHATGPLKFDASIDENRRRMKVADHSARRVQLDRGLGANVPVDDAAANDDRGNVNFCVHLGALADDESVVALNLSAKDAVDADPPFESELAVEFGAASEQGRNLGGRDLLFHSDGPTRHRGPRATEGWICQRSPEARILPLRRMKLRTRKMGLPGAHRLAIAFLAGMFVVTPAMKARAHGGDAATGSSKKEATNPFRGSTFTFDQSITTQTADVGTTPQTYAPLYELWFSFRPRYSFDEHWALRGRFDYSKQLTNNQQAGDYLTTKNQADVFGDIWTDFFYATKLDSLWPGTTVLGGVRAIWPTSQVSQANGTYVTLGVIGDVAHTFELKGEDAPVLNNVRFRIGLQYQHAFTEATTPTYYGNFAYTREDVDDHSFVSDQIGGQTLVNHRLVTILEGALQVTPKLSVLADGILIDNWHYSPTANQCIATTMGCAPLQVGNDQQFTEDTWLLLDVDYALFDEVDLGLGYYNLANALGPDGQRRGLWGTDNIWWSPDARFFFDVTANLDAIFDDARNHKYSIQQAAQDARRRGLGF